MADPRKPVMTGGCQCGAVRFALFAAPEGTHLCHCRMCQKAVGNAFAALAPVRKADFAWTRGAPSFFQSSTIVARGFCAACGTPLSFGYLDSEWIDVTIGSLDDPGKAPARRHFSVESRLSWLHFADDWPATRTEETLAAERRAALVSRQHPDRD